LPVLGKALRVGVDRRHAGRVGRCHVALARLSEQRSGPRVVASQLGQLRLHGDGDVYPASPFGLPHHLARLLDGGFGVAEAPAGERKVRSPPQRADQTPAVARATENLASLGELSLRQVVVALEGRNEAQTL
jgi:hypothetical protein